MRPFQSLESPRTIIRRFGTKDKESFVKFLGDKRIRKNLAFDEKATMEEGARELLAQTIESYESNQPMPAFAIENKTTGDFIGACGLNPENENEIEVFYAINPDQWGKGLATEVLGALVIYIFKNSSYRTINAYITRGNEASIRVVQKNRFENQGLVRNPNFSDKVYLFQKRK